MWRELPENVEMSRWLLWSPRKRFRWSSVRGGKTREKIGARKLVEIGTKGAATGPEVMQKDEWKRKSTAPREKGKGFSIGREILAAFEKFHVTSGNWERAVAMVHGFPSNKSESRSGERFTFRAYRRNVNERHLPVILFTNSARNFNDNFLTSSSGKGSPSLTTVVY